MIMVIVHLWSLYVMISDYVSDSVSKLGYSSESIVPFKDTVTSVVNFKSYTFRVKIPILSEMLVWNLS